MRDHNTESIPEFLVNHVVWVLITFLWFKNLLFRCLDGRTYKESRWILWGLIILSLLAGCLLCWRHARNGWNVFANIVTGYGLFTVFAYYPMKKWLILGVLGFAAALSAAYALLVFCRRIRKRSRFQEILIRRLFRTAAKTREFFCFGMLAIMLLIGINGFFGFSLFEPKVKPARKADVEEQTIDNCIDTLVLLQEETWAELSIEKKLDVLQTVANIEQRYLGLPNELNVSAANLEGDTLSYYDDRTHGIVVSIDHLRERSSYDVLDSVCHEAYHSLQNRMVDAYDGAEEDLRSLIFFRRAAVYKSEFADYADGMDGYFEYAGQACEADARKYASEAAEDYMQRIEEYIGMEEEK